MKFFLLIAGLLAMSAAVPAGTLQFTFEKPDSLSGSSLNAYWFPRTAAEKHSAAHAARVWRDSAAALSGSWSANLAFTLDGAAYPSAGAGFQFPEGMTADLRSLRALHITMRSNTARTVRVSFSSAASGYDSASDTGASYGYDIALPADSTVTSVIDAARFSFPKWVSDLPGLTADEILAEAKAIQVTVSCDSQTCVQDSGRLLIDDIILEGVDGDIPTPAAGSCTEANGSLFSDFSAAPYAQNRMGGWWYTYTDSSSSDTSAHGHSLVKDTAGNWSATGWAPDPSAQNAPVSFLLRRGGVYSGYAALESQISTAAAGLSLPDLHAISFTLTMDSGFPDTAASVIFHVKKAGSEYVGGRDHQVRIPYRSGAVRWCLALDSLEQPDWVGLWKSPFTPDSLLSLTWEVRLVSTLTEGEVGFTLDSVVLHYGASSGVRAGATMTGALRVLRQGGHPVLFRTAAEAAEVFLFTPDGRVLGHYRWPAGEQTLALPAARELRLVKAVSASSRVTMMLPAF